MALSTNCCLNIPSPSSLPPPNQSKLTNQVVSWQKKEDGSSSISSSWRKQCFVGMACMVMMGTGGGDQFYAIADDHHLVTINNNKVEQETVIKEVNDVKWSDKVRACPSWIKNSWETIVPENLPRPSAHRRWESARLAKKTKPSSLTIRSKVVGRHSVFECFSL